MDLMIVPENGTKLDVLAMRYRTAFDKTKAGRQQWIEGTLELAVVVAEAKRLPELASTILYNRWLERNGLQGLSPQQRSALNSFALDLGYARQLLETSISISWEQIWRTRPNKPQSTLSGSRKGTDSTKRGHLSGSGQRKRALRIPTVMQHGDDGPAPKLVRRSEPRPARSFTPPPGLTREQVDPDFKGTSLEFVTQYGHVNLQTKAEIEHNKRQETLSAFLGAMADFDRAGRAVVAALEGLDPETLREWRSRPGKLAKLQAWCKSVELAAEKLRDINTTGNA